MSVISEPKPVEGVIETQPPIRSVKTAVKERTVPPKGIINTIVESPVEIEISPRVVVDVVNLRSSGSISPRSLGIDLYIVIAVITAVVVSIGKSMILGIVQ